MAAVVNISLLAAEHVAGAMPFASSSSMSALGEQPLSLVTSTSVLSARPSSSSVHQLADAVVRLHHEIGVRVQPALARHSVEGAMGVCGEASGKYKKNGSPRLAASARERTYSMAFL